MPDLGPGLTNKSGLIEDDAVDLLDLLLTISGSIKLLTIGPLAAGLVALGIAFTIPPTFTARTSIIPPTSAGGSTASSILESLGPLAGVAGGGLGLKDPSAAITAYLGSDTILDEIVVKFELRRKWESSTQAEVRDVLKGVTRVTSDKRSSLLVIEVDDQDPAFAAELANAYVIALKGFMQRIALENARAQREFLETYLEEAMRAPYQSPMVGEAIIQGLIRQVEMARIDEASDGPFITQVDVAEPPELKSKPKKALIAVLTSLAAGFALLLFIFLKQAIGNGSADPGVASKLKKIKQSLCFWRSTSTR